MKRDQSPPLASHNSIINLRDSAQVKTIKGFGGHPLFFFFQKADFPQYLAGCFLFTARQPGFVLPFLEGFTEPSVRA
ncbi:MAG: hypothetical protein ACD_23C00137G0001 [uncultured bacterium]|nr:MAG: hypothetical protein ACD_23C00137G0001 [uncultured bacterium]